MNESEFVPSKQVITHRSYLSAKTSGFVFFFFSSSVIISAGREKKKKKKNQLSVYVNQCSVGGPLMTFVWRNNVHGCVFASFFFSPQNIMARLYISERERERSIKAEKNTCYCLFYLCDADVTKVDIRLEPHVVHTEQMCEEKSFSETFLSLPPFQINNLSNEILIFSAVRNNGDR